MSVPRVRALLILLVPLLVYFALITRGDGDLFGPGLLWKAYNIYALSMLDGSLEVTAEAIRAEGLYIDGHVYMYYGALPAALRMGLAPFVDLTTTPVARLIIFSQLAIAAGAAQFILLRIYRRGPQGGLNRLALIVVSFAVWFASGFYFLVQSPTLYVEPFVSGMMLVSVFAAMAFRDLEFQNTLPGPGRLVVYGLLAALCIHTRQTMAISLVLATIVLVAWPRTRTSPASWLGQAIVRGAVPMLLIGASGLLFLWMNHVRFGSAGTAWEISSYGYYLIQGDTERFRAFQELGKFDVVRIIPNAILMLFGGPGLHQWLVDQLGLIFIRLEQPLPRVAFTWAAAFAFALWGLWSLTRGGLRGALARPQLWLALCFAVSALLQLSYTTITFRYHTELWPVTCFFLFFGYKALPLEWMERRRSLSSAALILLLLLSAASAAIVARQYQRAENRWAPISPDNYDNPLHPVLARAAEGS